MTENPDHITRWVDDHGAIIYLLHDCMIGRVRHTLPEELTDLKRPKAFRGLSFGLGDRSNWNAYGAHGVCFTLDRSRLDNLIYDIGGHAVHSFTEAYKDRHLLGDWENLELLRRNAVSTSRNEADEAYVLGDIRPLHQALISIKAGPSVLPKTKDAIADYLERFEISAHA